MDKTKEEEEEDVSSLSESLRNGFREIIKTGEFKFVLFFFFFFFFFFVL